MDFVFFFFYVWNYRIQLRIFSRNCSMFVAWKYIDMYCTLRTVHIKCVLCWMCQISYFNSKFKFKFKSHTERLFYLYSNITFPPHENWTVFPSHQISLCILSIAYDFVLNHQLLIMYFYFSLRCRFDLTNFFLLIKCFPIFRFFSFFHFSRSNKQANDVNMFRLQFAYYVAPSWIGVARRKRMGRNGSRTGKFYLMNECLQIFFSRTAFVA